MCFDVRLGRFDHRLIVRGNAQIRPVGNRVRVEESLRQAHVTVIHIGFGREGHLRRLLVRPFAQPDKRAFACQRRHIGLAAEKIRLDHDADIGVPIFVPQGAIQVQGALGVGTIFHVDCDVAAGVPRGLENRAHVIAAQFLVDIQPELCQLERNGRLEPTGLNRV